MVKYINNDKYHIDECYSLVIMGICDNCSINIDFKCNNCFNTVIEENVKINILRQCVDCLSLTCDNCASTNKYNVCICHKCGSI